MEVSPPVASGSPGLSVSEKETLKKTFAEQGYFVIPGVVSPEKLAQLHQGLVEEFDAQQRAGVLFQGGGLMSGHLNCGPGQSARFVYDTLEARGILDLVRELGLPADRMPNIGCNYNLPGSATQHYHTDHAYTKPFLILNVAVVDTDLANGAMELIPGSHRRFWRFWRFALERPDRNSVRVPMKRGDILVRTSNVWHRGMPNRTQVARPMLALTWEDGGSVHADPFALDGGKIVFRPNWFRPTRMGRIRERIFVTLPFTYTASRILRSLLDKEY